MQDNWFKNRLTPAKGDSALWAGFADAMQSLLESAVLPLIQRSANRKSILTMEKEDLQTRIKELGRFFYINDENGSTLPMLLQQRLDEIHFKGTARPIESTLWREFKNMSVTWEPLYAPVDQDNHPYGSLFVIKAELEAAKEKYGDFFLTSRARLNVALNELYDTYNGSSPEAIIDEFISQFRMVVEPLIPLTIVFDGMGYYLNFQVSERAVMFSLDGISTAINSGAWFTPPQRAVAAFVGFDVGEVPAQDVKPLVRSLTAPDVRFDNMPMDGWALDAVAEPVILPPGQNDGRLIVADGVATVQTKGFSGCVTEYSNGRAESFTFPDGVTRAILPIDGAHAAMITKVTYRQD